MFVIASVFRLHLPTLPLQGQADGQTDRQRKSPNPFFLSLCVVYQSTRGRARASVSCLLVASSASIHAAASSQTICISQRGGLTSITNTPLYERAVMFLKYVGVRAPCTRLFDSTQTSAAHTVFREVKKEKR